MSEAISLRPSEEESHDAVWRAGMEMDLQAAMALARASTTALLELSPLAHREIRTALNNEVEALESQGDHAGLTAANLVRQCIPKGAR